MTPAPQQQLKSYTGPVASGGNPSIQSQRSIDGQGLTGNPIDVGQAGGEASIYSYLFRNPNSASVYVNIFAQPAGKVGVGVGAIPIGRLEVPGTSSSGNQLFGPQLFAPYYYGAAGLCFVASTVDTDAGAFGNAPASALYYELTWN